MCSNRKIGNSFTGSSADTDNPWVFKSSSTVVPVPGDTIAVIGTTKNGETTVRVERQPEGPVTEMCPHTRVLDKETVNHPDHYKEGGMEVIDVINAYSHVRNSFALGNAIKYILRAGKKNHSTYVEDLKKAIWYLNSEVEYAEKHYNNSEGTND